MQIPVFKWWDLFRGHRYHKTFWKSQYQDYWVNQEYENVDTKVKSRKKKHQKLVAKYLQQINFEVESKKPTKP